MSDALAVLYPWTKALHLISVIAWLAGMFYLPRLYAYHAETEPGTPQSETFKIMERRLLRAIVNPAMISTFVFGILLLGTPGVVDWSQGWIWVKLAAVTALAALHGAYSRWRKDFEADRNSRSPRFYKVANELPTLLMVLIVIMVIVKPF